MFLVKMLFTTLCVVAPLCLNAMEDNERYRGAYGLILTKKHDMLKEFLVQHKDVINAPSSPNNNTLLLDAVTLNAHEAVTILLRLQANPHHSNNNGDTALMIASAHGKKEIVRALLQNAQQRDNVARLTMSYAASSANQEHVKTMLQAQNHQQQNALCQAADEETAWILINFATQCGLITKETQGDLQLFENIINCDPWTMLWLLFHPGSCENALATCSRLENQTDSCCCMLCTI